MHHSITKKDNKQMGEWVKWESYNLQVEDDGARADERLVTAGHTLHSDREGAISISTVILK